MRHVALIGLVLVLAACGGSTKPAAAPSSGSAAPSAPTSAAASGITCAQISGDLQNVLTDLKTEDAKEQEAWVSGGDSADLQALINDTNGASGSDPLNSAAQTFNTDASAYLSDNSPYLAPGWETGYHQVRQDINAMATACGMTPVPASPGTS